MDGFRYKNGDRPLEGYTIGRAVGRGGFGEVYFAVSDAGREVALKVIQSHEQIELRGVSACMNLKSPHLVAIYDVRHNDEGVPFVIMEYVSGPSLHELLNGSPAGLGPQKSAFFLREIAKGLTYLHDRGVVHRDLKPGNIFYEDGYVKIGDYGLSKAMSAGKHSEQTITVGTVHYMAPEIGQGNYDASIDVYALGCVLYEMLTGQTPFLGGSHGEILMKHLMDAPDLKGIEEPFATVIRKAMAKDPVERYHTAQEMVEAVFGTEHIRNSVSHFSPESLSMVADRVARTVTVGGGSSGDAHRLGGDEVPRSHADSGDPWVRLSNGLDLAGRRLEQAGQRVAERFEEIGRRVPTRQTTGRLSADAIDDPLNRRQRLLLALFTAGVFAIGCGAFVPGADSGDWLLAAVFFCFMFITVSAFGLQLARKRFFPRMGNEAGILRHLVFGGPAAIFTAFLCGPFIEEVARQRVHRSTLLMTCVAVYIVVFVVNWYAWTSPDRDERVSRKPLVSTCILAAILAVLFQGSFLLAVGLMAGITLATQVASPFRQKRLGTSAAASEEPSPKRETPPPGRKDAPLHNAVSGNKEWPVHLTKTHNCSEHLRGPALLLACAGLLPIPIPLAGLHRFYVGKSLTGVLWFFTGGLMVIGTILDVIAILTGTFRDKNGRPLVAWWNLNELDGISLPAPKGSPMSDSKPTVQQLAGSFGNAMLAIAGFIVLVAACVFGVAVAIRLTDILSAGWPDPHFPGEMRKLFGYDGWPQLLRRISWSMFWLLTAVGTLLVIISRRSEGFAHVFRAILGAGAVLFAVFALTVGFKGVNWPGIIYLLDSRRVGPGIEMFLDNLNGSAMVGAVLGSMVALALFTWPSRYRRAACLSVNDREVLS